MKKVILVAVALVLVGCNLDKNDYYNNDEYIKPWHLKGTGWNNSHIQCEHTVYPHWKKQGDVISVVAIDETGYEYTIDYAASECTTDI